MSGCIRWTDKVSDWTNPLRELIDRHYDPAYARSSHAHYTQLPQARRMDFRPNDADVVEQARALLAALE